MKDLWLIMSNVALPVCAGITFFALARFTSHVAPMRLLITGEKTYRGAAWGFAFFGAYLISRPLQILLGPDPMPLVINCLREFCMMALFAPAVFVAMMSLCFGEDRVPRKIIVGLFALGFVLGVVFVALNVRAMNGSVEIFRLGRYPAYDGVWFRADDAHSQALMSILFVLRFIDPLFLLLLAGVIVYRHARHYPEEKGEVYDNMQKKLYFLAAAVFAFPVSMLITGVLVFFKMPNQWWVYYLGALIAGLLEAVSLSLPLRRDVQVSEHSR